MRLPFAIDFRGEMFSSAFTFVLMLTLRLGSSVVMSRLLYPEAYGLLAILLSIVYAVEMLSDVGVTGFVVRHERAEEQRVINTLWTLRFIRGIINGVLLFSFAPWIGSVYGNPLVGDALRALSAIFILNGMETLGFSIAARHKRFRIVAYVELVCTVVTTLVTILLAYVMQNHWALVISVLLQRVLMTFCSYFIYPDLRPRFELDKTILRPLFEFSKYIMPASILTLALTQYDKLIFLRLFELKMLGLYGVAQNISGTVSSLITRVCQTVLYPRCAQYHREAPQNFAQNFYTQNRKMFVLLLGLPAVVGGAAPLIVEFLYDPRFEFAGFILRVMMIRVTLESLLNPSVISLIAINYIRGELISSFLRLTCLVVFSWIGYWLYGFTGFLIGVALEPIAALTYITRKRYTLGLGKIKEDMFAVLIVVVLWTTSTLASHAIGLTDWWSFRFR